MPQTVVSRRTLRQTIFLLLAVTFLALTEAQAQNTAPELLTYEELVQLYEQPVPAEALQQKLTKLLNTPFVSNATARSGIKPIKPRSPALGPFLRVVFWNIERGLQYEAIEAALGGSRAYAAMLSGTSLAHSSANRSAALKEAALISQPDVIVLNELDWGMKRTDYRGRIGSQVAAEPDAENIAALVFLGYPLHPPGNLEKMRDAHLKEIKASMLFLQGSRDAFGTAEEIRAVIKKHKLPATLYVIESGDHSFKVPKSVGVSQEQVYELAMDEIEKWLRASL
ncbi:MAG: alpha/beta family hydrolase [Pyrinomonadaceae bacterium]